MRERKTPRSIVGPLGLACASLLIADVASATEGYFQNGIGARHKALAGAGVADANDPTTTPLNPAGLVDSEHGLDLALSLFAPNRGFTGSGGPGFTPSGEIEGNETSVFLVPDIAYSRAFGENGAIGLSLDGNGGMNTDYAAVTNPACAMPGLPAPNGVFCGGEAGVDLVQAFVYAAYAHDFDGFSVGVAPVFALQAFEAKGLAAFGGITSDPANLTNNGQDVSTGFGLRLGAQFDVTDQFRIGASYQTEINMSEFDDYAGLFEGSGDFDIPANYQVGVAFDASEDLTVMLDYRHIAYGDIASIANPMTTPLPLGSAGGPGFGWDDVGSWKLGVEYDAGNGWTWRGGIASNDNPVPAGSATFNILAPGIVTQHYTAGFEKQINDNQSIQLALMYAPEDTVNGIEITPAGPNPGHNIELRMDQLELTVGWTIKFGQ